MFTGIITAVAGVQGVSASGKSIFVRIEKPAGWKMKEGESVSIDGICSTVKVLRGSSFEAEYMPETIKKTTAKFFKKGMYLNLERSLRLNNRLGGHLVQGHVDTTAQIEEIKKLGNSVILKIGFPKRYARFIAEKGAISVNGVSLTVVAAGGDWLTVSLVSYTLEHTNLRFLKKGDTVNLEVDVLARYLEAIISAKT